jgi:hypothetical protein
VKDRTDRRGAAPPAAIADAHQLLGQEPSPQLIRDIARVAVNARHRGADRPRYFAALDRALEAEPPPWGTTDYAHIYRELAAEPRWMAVSLATNAEREGDGAERLWSLAAFAPDTRQRDLLKRHACDESRHALIYLALLDLSFPGAVSPAFRKELRQLSPGYAMTQVLRPVAGSPYAKEPTIDDYLQMNIAEMRTTIHHILQRPMLNEHCPPENRAKITALHDALLTDELSHVSYTAMLIDESVPDVDSAGLAQLFIKRFHDFNAITTEELRENVFDCSKACCAKRQHCRAKAPSPSAPVLVSVGLNSH